MTAKAGQVGVLTFVDSHEFHLTDELANQSGLAHYVTEDTPVVLNQAQSNVVVIRKTGEALRKYTDKGQKSRFARLFEITLLKKNDSGVTETHVLRVGQEIDPDKGKLFPDLYRDCKHIKKTHKYNHQSHMEDDDTSPIYHIQLLNEDKS